MKITSILSIFFALLYSTLSSAAPCITWDAGASAFVNPNQIKTVPICIWYKARVDTANSFFYFPTQVIFAIENHPVAPSNPTRTTTNQSCEVSCGLSLGNFTAPITGEVDVARVRDCPANLSHESASTSIPHQIWSLYDTAATQYAGGNYQNDTWPGDIVRTSHNYEDDPFVCGLDMPSNSSLWITALSLTTDTSVSPPRDISGCTLSGAFSNLSNLYAVDVGIRPVIPGSNTCATPDLSHSVNVLPNCETLYHETQRLTQSPTATAAELQFAQKVLPKFEHSSCFNRAWNPTAGVSPVNKNLVSMTYQQQQGLKVSLGEELGQAYDVEVYSLEGRELFRASHLLSSHQTIWKADTAGVYIATIKTLQGESMTKQLLVLQP